MQLFCPLSEVTGGNTFGFVSSFSVVAHIYYTEKLHSDCPYRAFATMLYSPSHSGNFLLALVFGSFQKGGSHRIF
jgi:hypothetical protein